MKLKNKRIIIISGIAIISVIILIFFLRRPSGVKVEIAEVTRGDITSTISAPGIIHPLTEVQISSSVMGAVLQLPVKEGQEVKKGELLLQIDPTEFRAQVRRAQAGLEVAKANLEQARSQWNRARQLFKSDLIPEQEFETARTNFLLNQAQVKEAQANLEQALEQLRQTKITSPIQGTVTQINVELGENVITGTLNTPGTRLMVVADLSRMEVESQVDEADIAHVTIGQRAIIDVEALPEKRFQGSVNEIGYAAANEEQQDATVNYNVSILFEDTIPELKPGMTATSEIITTELKNVLMVPVQSIVTRPVEQLASNYLDGNGNGVDLKGKSETEAVFIAVDGTVQLIPVRAGVAGEQNIQIIEGLQQGQKVVVGPFNTLRDLQSGDRIINEQ